MSLPGQFELPALSSMWDCWLSSLSSLSTQYRLLVRSACLSGLMIKSVLENGCRKDRYDRHPLVGSHGCEVPATLSQ